MTDAVNTILPIVLLIALGYWMRRSDFVSNEVMAGLRKLVVSVALPAVLFVAFLNVELAGEHVALVALTFGICLVLLAVGAVLGRRLAPEHPYFRFLMTGFEAGMLGIGLFASAYGTDALSTFAVVDLGHELFIWSVFLALLLATRDGIRQTRVLAGTFIRSPVVIAILLGLAASLLGLSDWMYDGAITGGVMRTLEFLAALTGPLILIVVGYGLDLDRRQLSRVLKPVSVRLALITPLALTIPTAVVGGLLALDATYQAAMFTLLILPPPFIIPLYMAEGTHDDERGYVSATLTTYTLVTVVVFAAYVAIFPPVV